MNTISQIACIAMVILRVRASAGNEKWIEILKTAAALKEVQLFDLELLAISPRISLRNFFSLRNF